MGLFDFRKKRKEPPETKPLSQEETLRRWQEAYRANPQVYQKQDGGTLLGSCTLTEDVDTAPSPGEPVGGERQPRPGLDSQYG